MRRFLILLLMVCAYYPVAQAQDHSQHRQHSMSLDVNGMTMNSNETQLPRGCQEISGTYRFEVHAGSRYAENIAGNMYGYSQHEFQVEPCSLVTITLINDDEIRHQWMLHGLPRYLYPGGMFHLEAAGGQSRTGSFIVPASDATYLVHCDMAQHMEKGMKAQLRAGKGGKTLWAIAGISAPFLRSDYLSERQRWWLIGVSLAAAAGMIVLGVKR